MTIHHCVQHRVLMIIFVLSLSMLAACGSGPALQTPEGFVELEEGEQFSNRGATWKAVSADGATLMVRKHDNDTKAGPDFWVDALTREMTLGQGYELLGTKEVSLRSGVSGKRVELRGTMDEIIYRYEVTVFVVGDAVYTVEAVAPEEVWAEQEQVLRTAVNTLQVE